MTPSPTLLAIDTATGTCSVALCVNGRIDENSEDVGTRHSERVLPMIEELLGAHGMTVASVDAFAFGAGPGSFTGLRIACGVAQGLGWGVERPLVPIGNLAALALDASLRNSAARRVLTAVDARMNEAYVAIFDVSDAGVAAGLAELVAPSLAAPGDLAPLAERWRADTVAGDALTAYAPAFASLNCARLPAARASARTVLLLAQRAYAAGRVCAAAEAAPLYVRDRVALTIEERRARQGVTAGATR